MDDPQDPDVSIDSWMQDIRDRQIEEEAKRKKYLTRERDVGVFTDVTISEDYRILQSKSSSKVDFLKSTNRIIKRIEQLGPEGVDKLIQNG
jgi:hypothetical protein